MEHIIKQLKKGAKHTRLSSVEKAEMKSALLRHVETNPVRSDARIVLATSNGTGPVRSGMFERRQFVKAYGSILSPFQINNLRSKKTMPILVILGLLMGGSASFAAENALPGDVLFPVKVHVNESVRGAVAVTPKAKAEWGIRLVERRLEEVEKLAIKTDVSEETRQIASTNLGAYTERVHGRIAKFEEDDDSDDAILTAGELADMLRTHEEVLAGLSTQVAGAVATSTASTGRVSTDSTRHDFAKSATTTAVVATSTASVNTALATDMQSLESILAQLREGRGHAEKKHKELKRKYRREDDKEDGDDEDIVPSTRKPRPAVNMMTGTTTSATVGTSTASTQIAIPSVFPKKHKKDSDREKEEELRAIVEVMHSIATSTATTTAPVIAVPTEHTESRTEKSKTSESSESRDDDND
ncbi:MAG: DUF5667 domain-containing protein [Patescibacteria group bacterium]